MQAESHRQSQQRREIEQHIDALLTLFNDIYRDSEIAERPGATMLLHNAWGELYDLLHTLQAMLVQLTKEEVRHNETQTTV